MKNKKAHRKRNAKNFQSVVQCAWSLKIITPVFTRKKRNKLKSNNSSNERNKVTEQLLLLKTRETDICREYNLQEQKLPEELPSGEENLISNWWITGDSAWRSSRVKNSRVSGGHFPSGPVVKNLFSNAGDMGLIPGQSTKGPHAKGHLSPLATTRKKLVSHTDDPERCS